MCLEAKDEKMLMSLLVKLSLLELKDIISDRMIKDYEEKIADLQSVVNLQRSTIEGLKTGRYCMN